MSSQRSVMVLLLLAAAIGVGIYRSSVLGKPDPGPKPTIALITGGSGPYWQLIANGARAAAEDLHVDIDVTMPERDEDLESQARILNGLDVKKISGIALSPLDAEAQTRLIDRLSEDTFVVTVDSDAPLSSRLSYVGASNRAAGAKCAQLTKEAIPDGGKIAVLMANMSKDNMLERKAGFEEELAAEGDADDAGSQFEVVGFFVDEGDNERCKSQIQEFLQQNEDLAAIVGLNARHGPILLSVLKDEGALSNVKLVTFDTPEATLSGIEAGDIYATVAQDPYQYGYEATRLLASYCHRSEQQLPPPGLNSTMNIATKIVRQENLEEFRTAHEGHLAEAAAEAPEG